MSEKRFDWYPILELEELDHFALTVTRDVTGAYASSRGASPSKREASINRVAKHLLSALYGGYTIPFAPSAVSVPLRSGSYHATKPGKVRHSYTYGKRVYDYLLDLEWVEVVGGAHDGKHTRIFPSGDLKDTFDELGLRWAPQALIAPEYLVLLRDVERRKGKVVRRNGSSVKRDLPVPATPDVTQMQQNLHEINSFLSKQLISLNLSDSNLKNLVVAMNGGPTTAPSPTGEQLHLQDVQLTRIFSRGRMDLGGRFYRGWWQQIPGRHRPHITINEKLTVEVDYSAIALRIIYSQIGKPYPAHDDPYELGFPSWEGKRDERRPAVKRVFNALINDIDGVYRFTAKDEEELGVSEGEFRGMLESRHPEIASHLGTDIGLRAQCIDSQIAEAVMLDLIRLNIPVLPIHDSFIVTVANAYILVDSMLQHFERLVGSEGGVESDITKLDEHFDMDSETVEELADTEDQLVSGSDIELEELLKGPQSIMERFEQGWLKLR